MLSLIPKIPLYQSFYHFGFPKMLPFSVVVSLSYRCNSTCATCDVWKKPNDDLRVDEWRKIFHHLGHTPFYMTFTGGEPFLRADMHEVIIAAYQECRPEVITVPTNGILTKRILDRVAQICDAAPSAQ
ncbi:MAG: radical SAM protein, partial [Chloroflexi bacterium]|nr:radical SAM protein [Chloroflexota bacterium]